jgi:hypothetical protein
MEGEANAEYIQDTMPHVNLQWQLNHHPYIYKAGISSTMTPQARTR